MRLLVAMGRRQHWRLLSGAREVMRRVTDSVVYEVEPILHQNGRSRETRSLIVLMKNEPKVNYIQTEIHGSGRSILGV